MLSERLVNEMRVEETRLKNWSIRKQCLQRSNALDIADDETRGEWIAKSCLKQGVGWFGNGFFNG